MPTQSGNECAIYKGRASACCQSTKVGRYEFRLLQLTGAFFRTTSPCMSRRRSPVRRSKNHSSDWPLHRSFTRSHDGSDTLFLWVRRVKDVAPKIESKNA